MPSGTSNRRSELVRLSRTTRRIYFALAHPGFEAFLKSQDAKQEWVDRLTFYQHRSFEVLHAGIGSSEGLAQLGKDVWKAHPILATKAYVAGPSKEDAKAVVRSILARIKGPVDAAVRAAVRLYVAVSTDLAVEAGSKSLEMMGLRGQFQSSPALRQSFVARASKILDDAYGTHVDELSRIVARAASPALRLSEVEVAAAIERNWEVLTEKQARTIARTETTRLWGYTQREIMKRNGIEAVQWFAGGPDPCPLCTENEIVGPIALDDHFPSFDDAPPAHPNCQCDVIPIVVGWQSPEMPVLSV